jgi:uncharacterized protein YggT (Ycf19 family)
MNQDPSEERNLEHEQRLREEEEAYILRKEQRELEAAKRASIFSWIINTIYTLVGFLQVLLFLRFFLRLLGANPENQFAQFIYSLSEPFIAPFATLFISPVSDESVNPIGGMNIFDLNAIVAMIVYALLCWLAVVLVKYFYNSP